MAVENTSGFTITRASNYEEFCLVVAREIKEQLKKKPDSRLALPAGHSPRGYYNLLAQASELNEIDWRQSLCFALDDYLSVDESQSFQSFLENHLYRFTNVRPNVRFNPRLNENYDELIAEQGGIDLCVLGLGTNGHIAFNEPPTIAASWTHCVFLTRVTREANKAGFISNNSPATNSKVFSDSDIQSDITSSYKIAGGIEAAARMESDGLEGVPTRAVTMGIATILDSKRIVLAVSGEQKKAALRRALQAPADPSCPASYLTMHPNLLVVTDFPFS